jgi:peptide/nickel transport system ATP-binding protein/oligopeptide transport system ATP-binding protein
MSLLKAENISKVFSVPKVDAWFGQARLRAVDGVSLELEKGRTLGIVGESGSGKSTLARCLVALEDLSEGRVFFDGKDLSSLGSTELRRERRRFQMVFQDPFASLNPRHKVLEILSEPLLIHEGLEAGAATEKAAALMARVGLDAGMMTRFPHEFSGGQRQRIMIARAIASSPDLLVADEPVSSLDITVQAQILELLLKLKKELGMAMVFISHDLRVVERLSDEVAVMKDGKIIESGPATQIYKDPRHPYTQSLLKSMLPIHAALRGRL